MAYNKPRSGGYRKFNNGGYSKPEDKRGTLWNPNALPVPTDEGRAIIEAVRNGQSVTVIAVAGSGKTTQAKQICAHTDIRNRGRVAYFAFNKSVQVEASESLPAELDVTTFHSAGFSLLRSTGKRYTTDKDKLDTLYESYGERVKNLDAALILKLCRLSRINLAVTLADVEAIAKTYNVLANASELSIAHELMTDADMSAKLGTIDYDDMIRIPALMGLTDRRYSFAIVDEAQDLSKASVCLIKALCRADCRYLIVGDPMQAIYGFAGASAESLADLTKHANAVTLPLSISWRCDTAIVEHANEIEGSARTVARPSADTGKVETLEDPRGMFTDVQPTDLILCRVRASLVNVAFRLYRDGTPFRYMGESPFRQICGKLYAYVKGTGSASEFRDGLQRYIDEHDTDLDALALDPDGDTVACSLMFARTLIADGSVTDSRGMYALADELAGGKHGVRIATVHKAKGLESDTVYVVDPELMPHPKATTEFEKSQERNLQYVARTRAKHVLRYVSLPQ